MINNWWTVNRIILSLCTEETSWSHNWCTINVTLLLIVWSIVMPKSCCERRCCYLLRCSLLFSSILLLLLLLSLMFVCVLLTKFRLCSWATCHQRLQIVDTNSRIHAYISFVWTYLLCHMLNLIAWRSFNIGLYNAIFIGKTIKHIS